MNQHSSVTPLQTMMSGCPINLTLETLGDRWSLIIVRDIMFGNRRHSRDLLNNSGEGIASNILADRLKKLVDASLLSTKPDPPGPSSPAARTTRAHRSASGLEWRARSPVHIFDETIAPSGLTFVAEGTNFGEWTGDILIGGLMAEGIVRMTLQGGQVVGEEVIEIGRRIRDVAIGPDGDIWLLTEHEDGEVLRLSPQG